MKARAVVRVYEQYNPEAAQKKKGGTQLMPDKSDQKQPGQGVKAEWNDDAEALPCKFVKQSELKVKGVHKAEVKMDSVMRRLHRYRQKQGENHAQEDKLSRRVRHLREKIKDKDSELSKEAFNRSKAEKDVLVQVREISALKQRLEDSQRGIRDQVEMTATAELRREHGELTQELEEQR
jgi:hypothetical protein